MQLKYFTVNGATYIQIFKQNREIWIRQEKEGGIKRLLGGVHISKKKLKELISEYASSLLDETLCFDVDAEREFFEDAKRERFNGEVDHESTVIFFLVKRDDERYGIGCSSPVVKIEEIK